MALANRLKKYSIAAFTLRLDFVMKILRFSSAHANTLHSCSLLKWLRVIGSTTPEDWLIDKSQFYTVNTWPCCKFNHAEIKRHYKSHWQPEQMERARFFLHCLHVCDENPKGHKSSACNFCRGNVWGKNAGNAGSMNINAYLNKCLTIVKVGTVLPQISLCDICRLFENLRHLGVTGDVVVEHVSIVSTRSQCYSMGADRMATLRRVALPGLKIL